MVAGAAPAIKDYGLKEYIRLSKDLPHSEPAAWKLVCTMPYNCFYVFDSKSHRLARELVLRKLEPRFYPGQHLEFLGEYGLWFYYLHTGDLESIRAVYDQTKTFLLETYQFGNARIWFDWGTEIKETVPIFSVVTRSRSTSRLPRRSTATIGPVGVT